MGHMILGFVEKLSLNLVCLAICIRFYLYKVQAGLFKPSLKYL